MRLFDFSLKDPAKSITRNADKLFRAGYFTQPTHCHRYGIVVVVAHFVFINLPKERKSVG